MAHRDLHLFIDGRRIFGGERDCSAVVNPATGKEIGRLPIATTADLDLALDAADRAFRAWRRTTAFERGRILHAAACLVRERAASIAEIITLEEGNTLAAAQVEVLRAADILDWCAEEGRRAYGRIIPSSTVGTRQIVLKEPIGPAVALTPWNSPALMPCRKIGEALAAGCSCIIKPAEETPASALEVVRALEDAGLPPGVVNAVFGVPADISEHLIASPVSRKISFTGSVEVGRRLGRLAGAHGKPITLELGGHAPVLIFEDADIERTADLAIAMKHRNAGQLCGSPTRFVVQESVHDCFLRLYSDRAAAIRVGDGRKADTDMGPLANPRRLAAMESLVADAESCGARVSTGGKRLTCAGYFFEPTVLARVPLDSEIMNREPFGPISAITSFAGFEDAVAEANRLGFGLAAYAFTRSARVANDLMDMIESGLIGLNTFAVVSPETPLGGVKESGYGSEGGIEGVSAYLVTKYVAHATG